MIRVFAAASAALMILGACPATPLAAAADGDQTIRVQNGQIRCLLSADFEGHGRPAAACGRSDGSAFSVAPRTQNIAVVQYTGELFFEKGAIPGPDSRDVILGAGQTYRANGWTVTTEELRTLITYDVGEHGMRVNPVEAAAIWL